jgi:hypothetical protein
MAKLIPASQINDIQTFYDELNRAIVFLNTNLIETKKQNKKFYEWTSEIIDENPPPQDPDEEEEDDVDKSNISVIYLHTYENLIEALTKAGYYLFMKKENTSEKIVDIYWNLKLYEKDHG